MLPVSRQIPWLLFIRCVLKAGEPALRFLVLHQAVAVGLGNIISGAGRKLIDVT